MLYDDVSLTFSADSRILLSRVSPSALIMLPFSSKLCRSAKAQIDPN